MIAIRTRLLLGHALMGFLLLSAITTGVVALELVLGRIRAHPEVSQCAPEVLGRVVQIGQAATAALVAIVVLGLVGLFYVSRTAHDQVTRRLLDIIAVARAHDRGDHMRRLDTFRADELGQVAGFINDLLDSKSQLIAANRGQGAEHHLVLAGLLRYAGRPAAVFTLGGRLLGSTLGPSMHPLLAHAAVALRARGPTPEGPITLELPEATVRLRAEPLEDDDALVGWLVSVADGPGASPPPVELSARH